MLTRNTQIRKEGESYRFILSDESVDRHGTIIRSDAWDLRNYEQNPVVLYMHQSGSNNPDNVIGKGVVVKEDGRLFVDVEFEPFNEVAQKIAKKVDFGSLSATSVGFLPKRGHWGDKERNEDSDVYYFDSVELLEASIVDIPSNANAIKKAYGDFLEKKKPEEIIVNNENKNSLSHFEARYKLINK